MVRKSFKPRWITLVESTYSSTMLVFYAINRSLEQAISIGVSILYKIDNIKKSIKLSIYWFI